MKTKIYDQHDDHTKWQSTLSFSRDEIKFMQKMLEEVSLKNTGTEIRKEIDHFQNQFFIQSNNIRTIEHDIARGEKTILGSIAENPVASDHRKTEDHSKERETVENFSKNFNDLRIEFKKFLAKTL